MSKVSFTNELLQNIGLDKYKQILYFDDGYSGKLAYWQIHNCNYFYKIDGEWYVELIVDKIYTNTCDLYSYKVQQISLKSLLSNNINKNFQEILDLAENN